ncbi:unnamed protein product [Durusdinium trenchii]
MPQVSPAAGNALVHVTEYAQAQTPEVSPAAENVAAEGGIYCGLLSGDNQLKKEAASLMAVDHGILLKLEQLAADSNFSPGILQDLKVVITPAIRILFQAYEEDGYHPRSAGGKHILRGLCLTLPDSKLVEDIHGVLRNGRGNRRNRRQTVHSFQELVTHSGVLATRSIQHKAHVGRDVFLRSFPKTRDTKRKRRYFARVHKLPQAWGDLCGRKKWNTLNEETLHRGVAALNFLRSYTALHWADLGVRIAHGRLSKFASELCVMEKRNNENMRVYIGFCLSNAEWGCLFWPLCFHQLGDFQAYTLDPQGEVEWVHVLNPQDWHVWDHSVKVVSERIYLTVHSSAPLLKHFLQNPRCQSSLTIADMTLVSEVLGMDTSVFDPKK